MLELLLAVWSREGDRAMDSTVQTRSTRENREYFMLISLILCQRLGSRFMSYLPKRIVLDRGVLLSTESTCPIPVVVADHSNVPEPPILLRRPSDAAVTCTCYLMNINEKASQPSRSPVITSFQYGSNAAENPNTKHTCSMNRK